MDVDEIKPKVFISYSTKNTDHAEAVCENLEDNNIPCWIAPRNIKTGTNYAKEIMDGLNDAEVVVLVFSKDAQESEYVNNEIDNAFNKGKCIVALKVDDTFPKNQMEFFLKNTQWLDASPTALKQENKKINDCYKQLVVDVKRVLKEGCQSGGHAFGPGIPKKQKGFFERYKLPILAIIVILIAIGGYIAYNSMSSNSQVSEVNEAGINIMYVALQDYGNEYSYSVVGSVSEGTNSSLDETVHVDFLDETGKVIDSTDTKISKVEGNILGSVDVSSKNVAKVSVELQDKNKQVLHKVESENIQEQ